MKEEYIVNNSNIDAYSKSWNQRESLSAISIMLDSFLKRIEEFRFFIILLLDLDNTVDQSLSHLEERLNGIESKLKYTLHE